MGRHHHRRDSSDNTAAVVRAGSVLELLQPQRPRSAPCGVAGPSQTERASSSNGGDGVGGAALLSHALLLRAHGARSAERVTNLRAALRAQNDEAVPARALSVVLYAVSQCLLRREELPEATQLALTRLVFDACGGLAPGTYTDEGALSECCTRTCSDDDGDGGGGGGGVHGALFYRPALSAATATALASADKGLSAHLVSTLVDAARYLRFAELRVESLRAVQALLGCLSPQRAEAFLPGAASGLAHVLLGDASTTRHVSAAATDCFAALLARGYSDAPAPSAERARSADDAGALRFARLINITTTTATTTTMTTTTCSLSSSSSSSSTSCRETDGTDAAERGDSTAAPRLIALLGRLLDSSAGDFSPVKHRSYLPRYAAASACREILVAIGDRREFAGAVPILLSALAGLAEDRDERVAQHTEACVRSLCGSGGGSSGSGSAFSLERGLEHLTESTLAKLDDASTFTEHRRAGLARLAGFFRLLGTTARDAGRLRSFLARRPRMVRTLLECLPVTEEEERVVDDYSAAALARAARVAGECGALDALVDVVLEVFRVDRDEYDYVQMAKAAFFANHAMLGALHALAQRRKAAGNEAVAPDDLDDGELVRACSDVTDAYLAAPSLFAHAPLLATTVLAGVRQVAESGVVRPPLYRRLFLHRQLEAVLFFAAAQHHEEVTASARGALAAMSGASRYASTDAMIRARLNAVVDRIESAREFEFVLQAVGAGATLVIEDTVRGITRRLAFQSDARAERTLQVLLVVCDAMRRDIADVPCSAAKGGEHDGDSSEERDATGDGAADEESSGEAALGELCDAIFAASHTLCYRQSERLRAGATEVLRRCLLVMATRRKRLLPLVAQALDTVPHLLSVAAPSVLLAACRLVRTAFALAAWFAESRVSAIWDAMAAHLPRAPAEHPLRRARAPADGGGAVHGSRARLAPMVPAAVTAEMMRTLACMPPESRARRSEDMAAVCRIVADAHGGGGGVSAAPERARAAELAAQILRQ